MAVYDNLSNLFTRFGRWIVRQTKGSYKAARLSHVIREEERKQDDLFRQIGEYYYQMYGKDADGQMKVWCDAIWNNKMMVIQYQSQKRLVKGVAYCPNCSQEVPLHSKYCNHCGARIMTAPEIQAKETAPFSAKICPGCGAVIADGDVFCANCGGRIPEKKGLKNFVKIKVAEHKEKAEQERREEENKFEDIEKEVVITEENTTEIVSVSKNENVVEEKDTPENSEATEEKIDENPIDTKNTELDRSIQEDPVEKNEESPEEQTKNEKIIEEPQKPQEAERKEVEDKEADDSETAPKKICHECGNPVEYGQNFCPKCGVKL